MGSVNFRQRTGIRAAIVKPGDQSDEEEAMTGWWHEHRIRERAYEIWEREGRPEGKALDHWAQAIAEIGVEEREASEEAQLEATGAV